jgi:hypothetical protein
MRTACLLPLGLVGNTIARVFVGDVDCEPLRSTMQCGRIRVCGMPRQRGTHSRRQGLGAASIASTPGVALGPLAGGWVYDAWLFSGSRGIGLAGAAISCPLRPARCRPPCWHGA